MYVWKRSLLLFMVKFIFVEFINGDVKDIRCRQCFNIPSPLDCQQWTMCGPGEVGARFKLFINLTNLSVQDTQICYTREFTDHTDHQGFHMGCETKARCDFIKDAHNIFGKRHVSPLTTGNDVEQDSARSYCYECCSIDDCNKRLCLSSLFNYQSTPSPSVAKSLCPPTFITFEEKCLYIASWTATWPLARQDCQRRGADLVSINSHAEQIFIASNLGLLDPSTLASAYWTSGYWVPSTAEFDWVDLTPMNFTAWYPAHPSYKDYSYNVALYKPTGPTYNEWLWVNTNLKKISTRVDETENVVSQQKEDISDRRVEVAMLKNKLKDQADEFEKTMLPKEMHDREPNLLFYGIVEHPKEDSEKELRNMFVSQLHFSESTVDNIYFKVAHRLPIKPFPDDPTPDAPSPIIASFLSIADRHMVLKSARFLKGTRMSIRTDLPAKLKKQRVILHRKSRELRERDNLQTRVRQVGIDYVPETRRNEQSPW